MLAAALLAVLAGLAQAATTVTLGFDDTTAGHVQAGNILAARGLKGTFFINSPRLGNTPTYMTLAQVQGLAAQGHEIAGHTLNHVDLTTLSQQEREAEVCDDRDQLVALGFNPVSFAYPFGAFNAGVQATVQSCGYTSARAVGGLSCSGCPPGETVPPQQAFGIRTPESVKSTTTLAQLQNQVIAAENAGGGWVPFVFHFVCDGCSDLSVSPATLTAFADWLAARASMGTVVRTHAEVMAPASTVSLWTTQGPSAFERSSETSGVNLGTRWRTSQAGQIVALKYYKPDAVAAGPKQGRLWNAGTGALLGSVSFPATTVTGWHSVDLPSPVNVAANTDYIVSYHTTSGYAATRSYFNTPRSAPPLTGTQGHYLYSTTPAMPTSTTGNTNYWADVVWRSTGTAPPPPPVSTSCVTSNGTFQNRAFTAQNGAFTARFEATAGDGSIDGTAGFSNGAADALTDLAPIMRFNLQGLIDARNGGAYQSVSSFPYTGGTAYKFRLEVNVPARTYSAFVTTGTAAERQIANNYAFRTEQSAIAQVNNLALLSASGPETVCHLSISSAAAPPSSGSALASIAVTPVSATIPQTGVQEFRAVGTRVNGSTVALNDHWSQGPSLPTAKRDAVALSIFGSSTGDRFFVFGGQDAGGPAATSYSIALFSTGPWRTLAPMPAPRYEASAVVASSAEDMWIMGGFDAAGQPTNTIFNYSADSNVWGTLPLTLPTLSACSLAEISGTDLYLLTGCDGTGNNARRLDYMDTMEGGWVRRADAPNPHANGASAHFGGRFYAVGGQSSEGMHPQLDRYDPATNTWATISTMPVALAEMDGGVINGKWYLTGGRENGVTPSSRTWIYDFAANTWSPGPSAPFARYRAMGGSVSNVLGDSRIFVAGGLGNSGVSAGLQIFDPTIRGVAWSASAPAIATVSVYGVATGLNPGSSQITASSSGVSGSASLAITGPPNPVPAIASISPQFSSPGSSGFTLTVRGSDFVSGSTVRWNGSNRTTTFVSASTLTASIPASDVASIGVASVTVFNPAPGGGLSNTARFAVTNWTPTAPMARTHSYGAASLLASGRVLVTGDTAEQPIPGSVYDPATGAWTATPGQTYPRYRHAQVRLGDGRVLIAGGSTVGECCLDNAEVYDPATGQIAPTPTMTAALGGRDAFLLNDGRVLYVGNDSTEDPWGSASASLFNVAGGTWSAVAARSTSRWRAAIAKLADGRVLVAGGNTTAGPSAAAEVWNPATGLWSPVASMPQARVEATATTLQDGRVLVVGGQGLASSILYSPATNSWAAGAPMSRQRPQHTATLRPDGSVLVAGAGDSQIYNPATNSWSAPEEMIEARQEHAAVLLGNNRVLAAGTGQSAELYTVAVTSSGPPPTASTTTHSLWTTQVPADLDRSIENTGVTLGTRWSSSASGQIAALKYYKPSGGANGFKTGQLWTNTGTLLGSVNFGSSTVTGWKQASFASPVPVTAGTQYVVSYFTTTGYAATRNYFVSPWNAPPLQATQGLYAYGAAATFPTGSTGNSNYWADVVFVQASTGPPPASNPLPALTALSPSTATAGSPGFTLTVDGSGFIAGSVVRWNGANRATSLVNSGRVTATIPSGDLASPTTATVTVFNPAPGGGTSNGLSFVVNPVPPPPSSTGTATTLWTTQGPAAGESYIDPSPVNVGVRFRSDVAGQITGLRFYKVAGNSGAHQGRLWTNTGTLLGSLTFSAETSSGWQTASFASPISISPNTLYVASYHSTTGYAVTRNYFNAARDNPPLHAPASVAGATNGLYLYSATPAFPTQSTGASNYWVDVVFNSGGTGTMATLSSLECVGCEPAPIAPGPVIIDLERHRVYPNPWRGSQHGGLPLTIDRVPKGSEIQIYSVTGSLIKQLRADGEAASWNLHAEGVASGVYFYRIKSPSGGKKSGKLAIQR